MSTTVMIFYGYYSNMAYACTIDPNKEQNIQHGSLGIPLCFIEGGVIYGQV